MWRPHRWENGCFSGDICVLMFILGSNVTLYEAKQKPVWAGLDSACVCVKGRMYLCVCVCVRLYTVCVRMLWVCACVSMCTYERETLCVCGIVYIWLCVCCSVWWHLLRCWLRAERSGLQEPQTKEMKAEVTTWTSGTRRHTRSHNTQIQSHTCKRKGIHTDCMHMAHKHC